MPTFRCAPFNHPVPELYRKHFRTFLYTVAKFTGFHGNFSRNRWATWDRRELTRGRRITTVQHIHWRWLLCRTCFWISLRAEEVCGDYSYSCNPWQRLSRADQCGGGEEGGCWLLGLLEDSQRLVIDCERIEGTRGSIQPSMAVYFLPVVSSCNKQPLSFPSYFVPRQCDRCATIVAHLARPRNDGLVRISWRDAKYLFTWIDLCAEEEACRSLLRCALSCGRSTEHCGQLEDR